MDALSASAVELLRRALQSGGSCLSLLFTVLRPLVGAVEAIGVTIAGPQAGNANSVVALERRRAAGDDWTGNLIAAIVTVCVFVAHEGGGNALAVLAAELRVCTLLGS